MPSYRGKVEITLTQGLAVSVTKAPRTVQIRSPSFVIRNTIRKKAKRCKNKADKKKKKCLFDKCVLCNNYGHLVTLYNYCLLCSVDEGVSSSYNLLKRTLGVPLPRLPAPSLRISLLIITEVSRYGRRECRGQGLGGSSMICCKIIYWRKSLMLSLQTTVFCILLSFSSPKREAQVTMYVVVCVCVCVVFALE